MKETFIPEMAAVAVVKDDDGKFYRLQFSEADLEDEDYEAGYNGAVDIQCVCAHDFGEPADGDGGVFLVSLLDKDDYNVLTYVKDAMNVVLGKTSYEIVAAW